MRIMTLFFRARTLCLHRLAASSLRTHLAAAAALLSLAPRILGISIIALARRQLASAAA